MHTPHDSHVTRLHRTRRMGWKLIWFRLAAFFAVMGPGFITANVDNDPGGILTYSQAGAKYGYTLLWTLIPTTIALIVVQEMAARMGAVTGKGLSDLIREEFGLRATFITMAILAAGRFRQHRRGVRRHRVRHGSLRRQQIPRGAGGCGAGVDRDRARTLQAGGADADLVFADLFHLSDLGISWRNPTGQLALHDTLIPQFHGDSQYLLMIVGLVGTTITPWMQFYLQASIVEKGVDRAALRAHPFGRHPRLRRHRRDRVLHRGGLRGHHLQGRRRQSGRRKSGTPPTPRWRSSRSPGSSPALLFAVGLVNASLLSAAILPLATAYNVCEGLGFESGVDRRFPRRPSFTGCTRC